MNDSKVVEFINDLKRAIQTGEFQQQLKSTPTDDQQSDSQSMTVISNLINVDNLSNQTFNYIINWLKQQQPPNTYENKVNTLILTHEKRPFIWDLLLYHNFSKYRNGYSINNETSFHSHFKAN